MESFVVTGASGFVGRHLVSTLLDEGSRVTALLRPSSKPLTEHPRLRVARGNLDDEVWLQSHMSDGDVLIHSAARVSDWATVTEIRRDNCQLTEALLQAATRVKVSRFVYVSTTDVYGHPSEPDWPETLPDKPRHFNWYAATKREAEASVRASGLPWVIARPATIYGSGSHATIGELADSLSQGMMLLVNGGRSLVGLIHVSDVVAGLLLCARHPMACGQEFNFSGSDDVTWRQFVDDLASALGYGYRALDFPWPVASLLGHFLEGGYRLLRCATGFSSRPLLSRQAVQILGVNQSFSHDLATKVLGYQPGTTYREGMAEAVAWLKANSATESAT